MEKASTPRNRLTRSSAKQVNTPKNLEQEESVDRSPGEEVKHNVRKSKRRCDNKAKTNGDAANIENRINNEDTVEDNMGNECEQEDLNVNSKSQDSSRSTPKKTPSPTISRRSLRTRRSSTSGSELEPSSVKMKRSSSFGKLDSVSTPTNRRGRRATSESKDFVFTPTKDKQSDLNSKYIPNSSLRIIEKIDEVNEVEKSSEDERETLHQGASNIESEGEGKIMNSSEKDNIVETTEIEAVIETTVKETDLPTHSETDVNDKVFNDSSSQKVCNGVKMIDVSQNNSGNSNKDIIEENKAEEINDNIKVEDIEPIQKPCLMTMEIDTKPPNPNTFSESNKSPEIGSPAEEKLELSESNSDIIFTELVSETEKKMTVISVDDEFSENPNCETQKSVEINEIIHDNKAKVNAEFEVKNIEIELDEDNEPEVSFKQLDDQLQSIMDEGMEDSDNEERSSHSKSDCKINTKIQNKTESLEISKIDLINSSDSEDGTTEEQPKVAVVMKCKDSGFHIENENIIISAVNKNDCGNESLKEQIETKTEENLSGLVSGKYPQINDPEIKDNHNHQKSDKVTEEDSKCDDKENILYTTNKTEMLSDQSRIDLLEDDLSNKREEIPGLYFMDSEPSKSLNIVIENPHTIGIEDSVPENSTSDVQGNNFQDPLLEDQFPILDGVHTKNEHQEKEINDVFGLRLNDQVTDQSDVRLDKGFKPESVENYGEESNNEENVNEYYEDEEINKSDEGSCDIYKGLSDSGSYVDEKADGSQFGESLSSELHSGSHDSEEEYVTSVDDEEEKVEEKTGLLNELCSGSVDLKSKQLILSKNGEKANEKNPDSPMTYDKALAIINKNRVKKIDDEEFFDMFTQELNRVSDESGSDSDIAIVDEYLMEPEEPAKKNQPKSGNGQSAKQPPRPSGPVLTNQPIPPENYPGDFSQPIHAQHGTTINQHGHPVPTQHSHAALQRVNYTQGALYQQFDQNMHLRGQIMYNQYAHPSSSMQDPHMFNPAISHPDVNFSSGMFNHPHPVCPVPESSFPSNNTPLKVRSVTDLNNVLTPAHKNYSNPDQAPMNERMFERQEGNDSYLNMSSTSVAGVHNVDTGSTRPDNSDKAIHHEFLDKKVDKSRTPILDLLGLDKKSLKLLKKVLGLNSIKRKLMKRDLEWQKKCLERSILKSELRQRGRKRETRYRNKRFRESDSSSLKSSSDQSSEESSLTSSDFSKGKHYGSSSENDNREINIEDKNIYVTLKTKNQSRHQNEKEFFSLNKARHSDEESLDSVKQKNKTKFRRKPRSSAVEFDSKKMTQKRPTVVKSQCGTFTVDPLTASSQSSDSEVQPLNDKNQVKELKRKMKRDLASGKNKLSNMFAQHSFKRSKESRGKVSEPFEEIKGPLRKENLKELRKLPSEILETLAKEDKKKKRHRTEESGSDDILERPKKIRKKSQKIKIKSKAGDQNYIPCVTGGATEFGLRRLDKDGTLTLAEKAAKFRMDQLYGASVKRITSKELMNVKKKQNVNDSLAKKRMSRKRNAE